MRLEELTKNYKAIPIVKGALDKLVRYAKLVDGSECYGFLLSPLNDEEGVVRDVMLAPHQTVSGSHAAVKGTAIVEAKAEMENRGYKPIGFWHSHGSHNVFHSNTDDKNFNNLMLSLAGNSEQAQRARLKPEGPLIVDGKIVFRRDGIELTLEMEDADTSYGSIDTKYNKDRAMPKIGERQPLLVMGKDLSLFINDAEVSHIVERQRPFTGTIRVARYKDEAVSTAGVAYSIVTNSHSELHGVLGVRTWCRNCGVQQRVVEPAVIDVYDGKCEWDDKQLVADIAERCEGYRRERSWSIFRRDTTGK